MLSGPGGFLLTSGIDPLTSLKEIRLAGTLNGLRKNEHAPGYVFAECNGFTSSWLLILLPFASEIDPVRIAGSGHDGGVGRQCRSKRSAVLGIGVLEGVGVFVGVAVSVPWSKR